MCVCVCVRVLCAEFATGTDQVQVRRATPSRASPPRLTRHVMSCPQVLRVDLTDRESVRRFVNNFNNKHLNLDILVNCAGVMGGDFAVNDDGVEMTYAANHVGCVCVHVCVCVCVCVYIYMCACVCTCVCICLCVWVLMCVMRVF